ncbi:MAG: iron-containing alcohol dehydrogenase [Oscillospiraceae bacterium]|nr:iron-containing alcohol dehydrogenase [Oscillospiraceae bacterium]
MKNFNFYSPTEIAFGKGAEEQAANLVNKHGGNRVFIVYGKGSAVRSGLLSRITDQFERKNMPYMPYGGVKPNPVLSHAREGIRAAIDFDADFILAVGGGSAIDEAKAIAHGVRNPEIDIWDFWSNEKVLTATTPVGSVLTISAAGSETSNSAVLTNDVTMQKRGLTTPLNIPRFAVMNPELAFSLPKYQIACGIVDIMMHTLERFFTDTDGNRMTDEIAISLLKTVVEYGPIALENPKDYDAMSELMWCGSLSHNGITGLGRPMDFSVHQFGHELSARYDVAHGASLSAVWGSWAEYCCKLDIGRFAYFAKALWGIEDADAEKAAVAGIDKTVEFFETLEMPTGLVALLGTGALADDVIEELADRCVHRGKRLVGNFKPLNKDDVYNIYQLANW